MARTDLLLTIVRAGAQGDKPTFARAVEAIIAEERARQHHLLADRLMETLKSGFYSQRPDTTQRSLPEHSSLFHEIDPRREIDDLILPTVAASACRELIEEQQRADVLRAHSLEPRNRVLLAGPPGNGKTTLAESLATALLVPFFVVQYEGIIGSFLGETATRLAQLFSYVRTRRCVLFFDEFDVLGKERGDTQETGEIKRVVSSLLLQIDTLPSYVVVVVATNHAELLDRAIWRRFQLRIELPRPTRSQAEEWFCRLERRLGFELGYSPKTLAEHLKEASFAELEDFGADIQRRYVLGLPESQPKSIVKERLAQWSARYSST